MSCPLHISPSRARALQHPILFQSILSCLLADVAAAPHHVHHSQLHVRDSGDPSSNDMSSKVWISLTVLLAVSFVLLACLCSKRAIVRVFGRYTAPAANTRELTADQLAGSINRNVNDTNNANSGRPRRTRRPRRTPSQISTTSLPAYMKEPGEHELVIFRGPADLQDVPQPAATVLPSMDEEDEQPPLNSQPTSYPQLPNSSSETPLLRPSMSSEGSNNSLHRMPSNNDSLDARGEVPPYEEALGAIPMQSPFDEIDLTDPSAAPASPIVPEQPQTQRVSSFRSFLNAMNPRLPQGIPPSDLPLGHQRADSSASNVSSITPVSRTRSRLTHHSSPSTSSSIFGALSRQRSLTSLAQGPLNSPSVISFNSISAPLTHTLVRTDITFPKSGPTPEQVRALSSREALGRFGIPYGADAIAYASSTSRQDLPPDFESATSTANLLSQVDPGTSGSSYLPFPVAPSEDATSGNPVNSLFTETATPASPEPESYEFDVIPQTPVDTLEEATPPSPAHAVQAPENLLPSSTMGTHIHKPKQAPTLPPSSFHTSLAAESGRRDSRMSSYSVRSYATAQESLSSPVSADHDTFFTPLNGSLAGTPKIGDQHMFGPPYAAGSTNAESS